MDYPKMILFDYGDTLLYEPGWDSLRGDEALMKFAVRNDNRLDAAEVNKAARIYFDENVNIIRKLGYDVSGRIFNRFLYEYIGIEFSLTPLEMEIVFWNGASVGSVVPGAEKMIDYINKNGIRSAVISNNLWSGEALKERFDRLLPCNKFEFIVTSSDYVFRKPNILIFDLALNKAGLSSKDVWFCGDNPHADVEGAANAKIFPVWFNENFVKNDFTYSSEKSVPECEHLSISCWDEVINVLERLRMEKI